MQDTFKLRDVSEDVKVIVNCVRDLTSRGRNSDFTLIHFVEMFKGDGVISQYCYICTHFQLFKNRDCW